MAPRSTRGETSPEAARLAAGVVSPGTPSDRARAVLDVLPGRQGVGRSRVQPLRGARSRRAPAGEDPRRRAARGARGRCAEPVPEVRERARRQTGPAGVVRGLPRRVWLGRVVVAASTLPVGHRPDGKRLHVERVINEAEAAVVRRIFEMAAGVGNRTIALTLNNEGALAPVPRRAGRSRSWAPTTVHEILNRPLYRGTQMWGRIRKRDQWGVKKSTGIRGSGSRSTRRRCASSRRTDGVRRMRVARWRA